MTEYPQERRPSEPLATVSALVEESGEDPDMHVPDPPSPVTLAAEQETMTAETGTVEQLENVGVVAWTVRVQLPPLEMTVHEAVAGEFPATTGAVPGLGASKLMVAGLTVSVKLPAVFGEAAMGRNFFPGITGGLAPMAASNAMESQPVIVLDGGDGECRGRRVCSGVVYRIVGEGPRYRSRVPAYAGALVRTKRGN